MPYDMIKAIKDAKARRKLILRWRERDKMKVQDIADRLDITKQRVSAILARARRD